MKIDPALPSPYHSPTDLERQTVGAVRAASRARDATDEPDKRSSRMPAVDPVERERLAARAERHLQRFDSAETMHAQRALDSYAQVAGEDRRRDLQALLGFDAYA